MKTTLTILYGIAALLFDFWVAVAFVELKPHFLAWFMLGIILIIVNVGYGLFIKLLWG